MFFSIYEEQLILFFTFLYQSKKLRAHDSRRTLPPQPHLLFLLFGHLNPRPPLAHFEVRLDPPPSHPPPDAEAPASVGARHQDQGRGEGGNNTTHQADQQWREG